MPLLSQDALPGSGLLILVIVAVYLGCGALKLLRDPLRKVPGPLLARFTTFWELSMVRTEHYESINIDLHKKYGHVVRLGPNRYSISNPDTIAKVYGHGNNFDKDQWYRVFGSPNHAEADLFSIIDEKRHSADRRKLSSLYSMSALVAYEPFVDACNATITEKINEFAAEGRSFDVPQWMKFYAFDVIGEITVGAPFGMMRAGQDAEGILHTIESSILYSTRIGLFYYLHPWVVFIGKTLRIKSPLENLFAYVNRHLSQHSNTNSGRPDFIHKLLELRKSGKVSEVDMFNSVASNIAAGSDTTGATLSAAIYYMTRTPHVVKTFREEMSKLSADGRCSDPTTFAEAQQMPYLQAIIKETLRIHSATGLPHVRVVPAEGLKADGYFFPAGTVLGVNPWVLHRNTNIFGADADDFRPERWLGPKEQVSLMDKFMFSFGSGSRTCIGKNISLLEMSKVLPTLFRHFDFQFDLSSMPNGKWITSNAWFVAQSYKCWAKITNAGQSHTPPCGS